MVKTTRTIRKSGEVPTQRLDPGSRGTHMAAGARAS